MGDEIRITVIATGFGDAQREMKEPAVSGFKEPLASPPRSTPSRTVPRDRDPARPVVHLGTIIDAATPTFQRRQPATERGNGGDERVDEFTISPEESDDHYEIPAFLRKNVV
jgi:hypothetical protein